jgi:predicted phage gp36 major capsid-like protein
MTPDRPRIGAARHHEAVFSAEVRRLLQSFRADREQSRAQALRAERAASRVELRRARAAKQVAARDARL